MERWSNRVAMVTGASAGIGKAICIALVKSGMQVVGAARRVNVVQELADELNNEKGALTAVQCDITKDNEVTELFEAIKSKFGGIDVCINNAGMSFDKTLLDGTTEEWRQMFDVNVIALCHCSKLAVASMRERGVDDGQIININSILGHVVLPMSKIHLYAGTKHAVRAITEGLRQELREINSHIRISEVSPGLVATEFLYRMHSNPELVKEIYSSLQPLQAEDVTSSVLHVLSAPSHVEINEIIIRPTESLH